MFKSMLTRRNALTGAAVVAAIRLAQPAAAVTPEEIKARGKLIIGIRRQPAVGLRDVGRQAGWLRRGHGHSAAAEELGVEVEFVPLRSQQPHSGADDRPCRCAVRDHGHAAGSRQEPCSSTKPYNANAIVLIGPKNKSIKTNEDMANLTISFAKGAAQDTQVPERAADRHHPPLRRRCGERPGSRFRSGRCARRQHLLHGPCRKPVSEFENKLEFQKLYNGACTRLGERN